MRIFELIIDEDAELYGIDAISLVDKPAIELDFVALNEHQQMQFATVDEDEQVLIGPALVPDKPIYRRIGDDEFYVFFSKSTVRRASELFMQQGHQNNHTLEHLHPVQGLTVVESWLVEDKEKDKSAAYGLNVPVGTWMVSVKVENDAIWQEWVKEGRVKGFSIEGYFVDATQKAKEQEDAQEMAAELLQAVRLETYSDYPEAVSNNAKRGIELNERNGNKCATQTGKVRAQQLAKGQPVSADTVKRMASYLARAEEYYDPSDMNSCGTISYLLWGGKAGKRWADSRMKEIEALDAIEKIARRK
jgi:hypothetical protein